MNYDHKIFFRNDNKNKREKGEGGGGGRRLRRKTAGRRRNRGTHTKQRLGEPGLFVLSTSISDQK